MKKFCVFACALIAALSAAFTGGCTKTESHRASYDITCEYSDGLLIGSETVSFYNFTENSFKCLKFNLYGNAFRKGAKYSPISEQYKRRAYYSGESYGETLVENVCSEGKELKFEVCGEDLNILKVELEKELFPEERAAVTIDFKVKLANVISRTGVNADTVNLGNFYPVLCGIENGAFYECVYYSSGDPFFSDCADYNVKFSVDNKFVVAASGETIDKTDSGNKAVYTFSLKNARSFALVIGEKFNVITDVTTGVTINYYYYKDASPEKSLKTAVEAIKFFGETYGEYPYKTFSVAETKFIQGGMEYPGLVYVSDELEEAAYREVVVHETAHQWWMAVVGNNETECGFLDEGLAEYSVIVFYDAHKEYGFTREQLVSSCEKTYKNFCTVYDKLYGKKDTSMTRSLKDFSSEYEYVNIAYVKPCLMYDAVRTGMGDAKFFGCLKKYYSTYKFLNAAPQDLSGVFEKAGTGAQEILEAFFAGKEVM